MKPIEIARDLYRQFGDDFESDRIFFGKHGYIYDTDKHFYMFRRHPERKDCWAIQMAVGDIGIWEEIMPFHLPFMAWGRLVRNRGKRVFKTETVLKMIRAIRRNK